MFLASFWYNAERQDRWYIEFWAIISLLLSFARSLSSSTNLAHDQIFWHSRNAATLRSSVPPSPQKKPPYDQLVPFLNFVLILHFVFNVMWIQLRRVIVFCNGFDLLIILMTLIFFLVSLISYFLSYFCNFSEILPCFPLSFYGILAKAFIHSVSLMSVFEQRLSFQMLQNADESLEVL